MIERKKLGEELDKGPKIHIINEFIENQLVYYENNVKDYDTVLQLETAKLDELFRKTLYEVWGKHL